MEITQWQVPIEPSLADELVAFWEAIFGISFAWLRGVLAGEEARYNRDILFLAREGTRLVGTSHITFGRATCEVGGLGEVAVDPEFRGRGIANLLCARARDVFRAQGGQAMFLGTTMPNAARVYSRLGWRTLAGTHVMLLTFGPQSSEEYLDDHFCQTPSVSVVSATAADRTMIIPLLVSPHDWCVLDANVRMFSTRYAMQNSCMGLYPQYQAIREGKRGNWFVARADNGCVVGLSTVRLDERGRARIDGFAHHRHMSCTSSLIEASIRWGTAHGASEFEAVISRGDHAKLAHFKLAGFRAVAAADPIELDGRRLDTAHLEMPVPMRKFVSPHRHSQSARSNK
jgi:GNAT superfamily N-acetyltransferase